MTPERKDIPTGWKLVELGDVCEFLDSKRKPIKEADRSLRISGKSENELYPYYGANGQVGLIDGYLFDEPTILLAEDGGYFGSKERPIAYKVQGRYWVNNHAHVLKPKNNIDFDFLFHSMEIRPDVGNLVQGATRAKLNLSTAKQIPIPLPPLEEQKRIAGILNKAEEIKKLRDEADKKTEELIPAIFHEMFGDPVRNEKGWELSYLGDIANNHDSQRIPVKASDRKNTSGGFPYYGASGIIDWVEDYLFDGEYLLIGEDGANLVARSTPIAFIATGKFWVNNHAHILTAKEMTTNLYLENVINQMNIEGYVTGAAQPKLNQKNLNRIPVPIPPITLQKEFGTRIQETKTLTNHQDESSKFVANLSQSLLQRAFRGEL